MKNIILLVVFLAGCSLIPSKFDSTLYDHTVKLSATVDEAVSKCGTSNEPALVSTMNNESKLILKYVTYTSTDLDSSVKLIDKVITEMSSAYSLGTPNPAYCKLKLEIINAELQKVLKAIGGKDK